MELLFDARRVKKRDAWRVQIRRLGPLRTACELHAVRAMIATVLAANSPRDCRGVSAVRWAC